MNQQATQSGLELTLARPVTLPGGDHPALVHLWWRGAVDEGQLVQVYVDGELYDATEDSRHQQMWLLLDRSRAHRIELLAVDASAVWLAQPEKLASWAPPVEDGVSLTLLRDERLAVDTRVSVELAGMVDGAPLWPSESHRGGFGALFGEGGFGFDAVTGPGLGGGEFGHGPLGADGTAWRWHRDAPEPGEHALSVEARDESGQRSAQPMTHAVTTDQLAPPPRALQIDQTFTLRWH